MEIAIANAAALYFNLGINLINSVKEENTEKVIPILREGIKFLDKSKKMGIPKVEEQLAIAQFLLSQHLFHSVIPNQTYSKPIGLNEIASLKEAVDLCESSTKHALVATEFLKQLNSIFAQVAPKEPKSSMANRQNFFRKSWFLKVASMISHNTKGSTVSNPTLDRSPKRVERIQLINP